MLLQLQRFNLVVKFKPGKELVIADTLSRDYPEQNSADLQEEIFLT